MKSSSAGKTGLLKRAASLQRWQVDREKGEGKRIPGSGLTKAQDKNLGRTDVEKRGKFLR